MISDNEPDPARAKTLERAVTRWENEGGATRDRKPVTLRATIVGKVGDAEAVNIRVRLIALENIVGICSPPMRRGRVLWGWR